MASKKRGDETDARDEGPATSLLDVDALRRIVELLETTETASPASPPPDPWRARREGTRPMHATRGRRPRCSTWTRSGGSSSCWRPPRQPHPRRHRLTHGEQEERGRDRCTRRGAGDLAARRGRAPADRRAAGDHRDSLTRVATA